VRAALFVHLEAESVFLIFHCSTAWAYDHVLDAWDSTDVTLQWCIIAEGLVDGGHEKGFLSPSNSGKRDYETKVHCFGNIGPHRPRVGLDEFGIVMILSKENRDGPDRRGIYGEGASKYISHRPFPTPDHAQVKAQTAADAYRDVLSFAGAWPRDEVDQRLVREVREKKGKIGRVGRRWREIYEDFQRKQREKKGK